MDAEVKPARPVISRFIGEYDFLSNFYYFTHPVTDRPITVEHLFQSAKTTNRVHQEWILLAPTPGDAKRRGRKLDLRPDWEDIKDDVMLTHLRLKFSVEKLGAMLMATRGHTLIEGNTWGDTYWGFCRGKGQNRLGELLMLVRAELQAGVDND